MALILMDATSLDIEPFIHFRAVTAEADFLFGPEIRAYIDEVYSHAARWRDAARRAREFPPDNLPGYDDPKRVEQRAAETRWFAHEVTAVKERFRKYLDISN